MAPITYTTLESLVLFQTLQSCKEDPPSFGKISETLKQDELLQDSESLDVNRLDPESLKMHFLGLLKEEVKIKQGRNHSPEKDGSSPRKRKRSTPPLSTVDEAQHYAYLIPQIVARLQLDFQEYAIGLIREEEERYKTLSKELEELERAEVDERPQQKVTARRDSRGKSSIETLLRHDEEEKVVLPEAQPATTASYGLRNEDIESQARPSPPFLKEFERPRPPIPTRSTSFDQKPTPPVTPLESNVPYRPPPQPINYGYPIGSPGSDNHRMLPPPSQFQTHPPSLPTSRSIQSPLPLADRSSNSPIILPPPKGMLRSSGSPSGPLDALTEISQQPRAHSGAPSPRFIPQAGSQQPPHALPPPRNYSQPPYQYYDHQPRYSAQYSPYGQGAASPANYQPRAAVPPHQSPLASPAQSSPYNNVSPYQAPGRPHPPQSPSYNQSPSYYQQPYNPPIPVRGSIPRLSTNQHTPITSASGKSRVFKPSPIFTSASSTRWKNVDTPGPARQSSPTRPLAREISPISDRAPSPPLSPDAQQVTAQVRPDRVHDTPSRMQKPANEVRGRGNRGKGGRGRGTKRGRGGRAISSASSTRGDLDRPRTRSQSITSQPNELSIDQSASTRRIKPEPSRASIHEDDASMASTTADESSRKPTRRRRGVVNSLDAGGNRVIEESSLPPPSPAVSKFSKPGFVLGTRNFARTSQTLMNEITTHKVASLFAKPLTEREAPGYKDLIYRPQDLKSIKNAISAGGRALVAAAEKLEEPKDSPNVWIPVSPDVVPPKGIVNSAQLEKELMHMFANAIMFNPDVPSQRSIGPAFRTRSRANRSGNVEDDDGDDEKRDGNDEEEVVKGKQDVSVVKDTREMFEAVRKSVAEWSGVERAIKLRGGGSEDVDELAGTGEEIVGSVEQQEVTPEPKSRKKRR